MQGQMEGNRFSVLLMTVGVFGIVSVDRSYPALNRLEPIRKIRYAVN